MRKYIDKILTWILFGDEKWIDDYIKKYIQVNTHTPPPLFSFEGVYYKYNCELQQYEAVEEQEWTNN